MGEREGLALRQNRFILSQGLQDDIAMRMVLRVFGCEHAFFLDHVYDSLIVGPERQFPATEPIGPTVPYLGNSDHPMPNMHGCQRRRHPVRTPTGTVMFTDHFMPHLHSAHDL